jgi:hypothetical protein
VSAPRFLRSIDRAHDRWELAKGRGERFFSALWRGEVPPVKSGTYEAWVRTLPCACCGATGPSEVSHLADEPFKALGSKVPSLWVWPSCRDCHNLYHRSREAFSKVHDGPWRLIGVTVLQAQVEGVLVVKAL